ncbi:DUF6542 domain-containing protein [Mycobacterium sp.]|uniref:DUF6542 domain-containing protein n=1 Tax=Mycobacterium sp. TaxID=1785 RepID=UPI0031DBC8F0
MPQQQDRSAVKADHRSIVPSVPGVPWWAAVVVALTGVAAGFAFDAGSGKELTSVFSGLYVVGCLAAVLAVRQSGVFTAVSQPPLILFCAVPGAYFLFHGAKFTGVKDLVINCGYPLIERFPLMLFTSAGVLLVGLVRWYLGMGPSRAAAADDADKATGGDEQRVGLVARLTAMLHRDSADAETPEKATRPRARREHAVERSARSTVADRRSGRRPATSSRTGRPRPPRDDDEPTRDRLRRRPTRDVDADEPPRRSRAPRDPELRGRPPRDVRRDPNARRGRPASRFDPYEPVDAPPPPPRRRPAPNGSTATHHPISQVRYRKAAGGDATYDDRPRRPRKPSADSWKYDA